MTKTRNTLAVILTAFLLATLSLFVAKPQPSIASTVDGPQFYTTGSNAELHTKIPIAIGSAKPQKKVIYSIPLNQITPGDLIDITVDMEATNPYRYNVMYGSTVVLTNSATATTGQVIARPTAFNITPDMHHGKDIRVGRVLVKSSETLYVNYIAWAAANRASKNQSVVIEKNYGTMTVINWGPTT